MHGLMTITATGGTGNLPVRAAEPANVEWTLLRGLLVNSPLLLAFAVPALLVLYLLRRRARLRREDALHLREYDL